MRPNKASKVQISRHKGVGTDFVTTHTTTHERPLSAHVSPRGGDPRTCSISDLVIGFGRGRTIPLLRTQGHGHVIHIDVTCIRAAMGPVPSPFSLTCKHHAPVLARVVLNVHGRLGRVTSFSGRRHRTSQPPTINQLLLHYATENKCETHTYISSPSGKLSMKG